jgi:hypothetical protein
MVVPGNLHSPSPTIDIDMTARRESVHVCAYSPITPIGQLIRDAVIDAQTYSAGSEVVALCIRVRVHVHKVTESSHPHTPAVFRSALEDRFHDPFRGFSVHASFVLQIHRSWIQLHRVEQVRRRQLISLGVERE